MKMKQVCVVVLMSLVARGALAEEINDSAAKVSFHVPAGWVKDNSGGMLALGTSQGDVMIRITRMPAKDLKAAAKKIEGDLKNTVQKAKKGKTKAVKINGLPASITEGSGIMGGKPVKLALIALLTPTDKAFVIVGVVLAETYAARKAELDAFVGGIKPLP